MAADEAVEIGNLVHVLKLVQRDEGAVAPALLEPERQVEQRMEGRERIGLRVELEAGADAEGAEREADPGPLEELFDARAERALQVLRVRALEPHRDVGDRGDAVEVDVDRDQPFALLAVAERPLQQARLPVLARREEADEVAADDVLQQLVGFGVAVDDVLGTERVRVDERVDLQGRL